ncbi:hypothetical protein GCM10022240_24950 [Microbacterium kribbense]|uniref:ATPase n=1 Tax=Microbacterium kribbense TaxID=433645 RepID=A0ABP7GVA4_9MICO
MKKFLWFLVGVAGGFVLAHQVNKDPRGHEVLAEIDARVSEFTDRIGEAYREQESRLGSAVDDATAALADATRAASEALDEASAPSAQPTA